MSEIMQPVPAATVVLARDIVENETKFNGKAHGIEVLLLLRNSKLVFNGGHWVFPGGKLDAEDFIDDDRLEYPAALNAAVRETREETGIHIDAQDLVHTAHWTTPENLPRRYSTWFFLCPILKSVAVKVDNSEILDYRWLTPAQALTEAENGQLKLPRPTRVTLKDMVPHDRVTQLLAACNRGGIRVFPQGSSFYRPEEMGFIASCQNKP